MLRGSFRSEGFTIYSRACLRQGPICLHNLSFLPTQILLNIFRKCEKTASPLREAQNRLDTLAPIIFSDI